jgi:hypothetical protein
MVKFKKFLGSKLVTIIAICCCSLYSCKKNGKSVETPTVDSIPTVVIPDPGSKHYVPISFKYNTQTISLSYLGQSAVLSEIKYSDGKTNKYNYNANQQLVNYEKYSNDVLIYSVDYLRNKDGLVIKVNQFKVDTKTYELTGYLTISYNQTSQISGIKKYNKDDLLTSEQTNEYNTSFDVSKKTITGSDKVLKVTNFIYDLKTGTFKYVLNLNLLALEMTDNFFISGSNNITSITNKPATNLDQHFTYSYNNNEYPSKYILTDVSGEKTYNITYKAVN